MSRGQKEVELNVPLDALVDTLCKLPDDDLLEVRRRIEERLEASGEAGPSADNPMDEEDAEFWKTLSGQIILSEPEAPLSMKEVLRITSKIKGSLAADVIAERKER